MKCINSMIIPIKKTTGPMNCSNSINHTWEFEDNSMKPYEMNQLQEHTKEILWDLWHV